MAENTEIKIQKLRTLEKKMFAFRYADTAIYLDATTVAPKETQNGRGEALAVLSEYSYELSAGEETVKLLESLRADKENLDAHVAREVDLLLRNNDFMKTIPQEEYVEYTKLLSRADYIWHKAKADNDFEAFYPTLKEIFDTNIRFARYYKPDSDPYDTCLDMYERGLTKEKCDAFFSKLRTHIVPLLKRITKTKQLDDSCISKGNYPVEAQKKLTQYVMDYMKIDPNHCNCGETEHPYTTEFSNEDVRITTHYLENNVASSMYSVIHEGGHALYELGGDDEHRYTSVAGGVSMGIHECISRFYENLIGKSFEFTSAILPEIKKLFPDSFENVTPEDFYKAVNKAEPSLIRTEADELTYCLHVMIRYEIEKKIFAGELAVSEIPSEWNKLYKEYLGVDVPDDTRGCLQDSHWSGGCIGYFPSYALGSAYGAQILEVMKKDIPFEKICASGSLAPINEWLGEHIFKFASMYDPEELFLKVCGNPFDASYFTDYLEKKFSALYNLN